jgi:hypothetical protein
MIKLIPSLEMLEDILRTIRIQDVLDILIVAYLVYKLIDLLRETRAGQLIKGVLGIILVYVLSQAFQLRAVSLRRFRIAYHLPTGAAKDPGEAGTHQLLADTASKDSEQHRRKQL